MEPKSEEKAEVRTSAEIQDVRWRNRRRMAWKAFNLASFLSVFTIVGISLLVIFGTPEKIESASNSWAALGIVFGGLWGVVMAYIGSAAYSDTRVSGTPKSKGKEEIY